MLSYGIFSNVFCTGKVVLRTGTNVIISPDASVETRNAWASQVPVVGPLVNGEEWRPTGDNYRQCKQLPGFEPKEELCLEYNYQASGKYALKYRGVNVDVDLLFAHSHEVTASLKNGALASENYGFCGGRNPGSTNESNGIALTPGRDNPTPSMPSPEPEIDVVLCISSSYAFGRLPRHTKLDERGVQKDLQRLRISVVRKRQSQSRVRAHRRLSI